MGQSDSWQDSVRQGLRTSEFNPSPSGRNLLVGKLRDINMLTCMLNR